MLQNWQQIYHGSSKRPKVRQKRAKSVCRLRQEIKGKQRCQQKHTKIRQSARSWNDVNNEAMEEPAQKKSSRVVSRLIAACLPYLDQIDCTS